MATAVRAFPTFYSAFGHQKLTVGATAVGFTVPAGPQVRSVILSCETNSIRFWVDGTDPDSSTGIKLNDGDLLELDNVDNIKNFKAIRISADATLQIEYFGGGC